MTKHPRTPEQEATAAAIRRAQAQRAAAERKRVLSLIDAPLPDDPDLAHRELGKRLAVRLDAQGDVRVKKNPAGAASEGTQRMDVFAMLHQRRSLTDAQEAAVRRLEGDMHIAAGAEGDLEVKEFVQGGGSQERVTQRMIDAGARVAEILHALRSWEVRLFSDLLSPTEQRSALTRWRDVVTRVTGAANPSKQAERVVVACEALTDAYAAIDYQPGRARA